MGYNQDRGDAVSVANSPFDGVDKPYEAPLDWWRDPANLPMAKDLAKFLITALILLYIVLRIVRPMMRPVFKKIDEINAPEPEPEEPEEIIEGRPGRGPHRRGRVAQDGRKHRALATAKTWPWPRNWQPRIHASLPTSFKEWIGAND